MPERGDFYSEVTAKIIAELQAGRFPWVEPWGHAGNCTALGLPRSALTRQTCSGINILIPWGAVIEHGQPRDFRAASAASRAADYRPVPETIKQREAVQAIKPSILTAATV